MIDSQLSRAIRERMDDEGLTTLVEVDRMLGCADKYLAKFLRGDQASLHREVKEKLTGWLGWTREAFEMVYVYHQQRARERRKKQYVKQRSETNLADIEGATFPLPTLNGTMRREPLAVEYAWGCNPQGCAVYAECRRAVLDGDFAFCERPLEREMVPESMLRQAA
jgi:dsDNA-binding SOS-regulon protein